MIALKKSKFHSNAVREFKIPRECCFSLSVFFFFCFRSKLCKCKFWRHCEIPWGVTRLRFVTPVFISANHKREQAGLPGLVLSKQSSFHPGKASFFPNDRINAEPPCLRKKIRAMRPSYSKCDFEFCNDE